MLMFTGQSTIVYRNYQLFPTAVLFSYLIFYHCLLLELQHVIYNFLDRTQTDSKREREREINPHVPSASCCTFSYSTVSSSSSCRSFHIHNTSHRTLEHRNQFSHTFGKASQNRIRSIRSNRKVSWSIERQHLISNLSSCYSYLRFLHLIKDEIRQAQGNEEFHFGNPINAHLFIKHLTTDWIDVQKLLPNGKIVILCARIERWENSVSLDFVKNISKDWIFPSIEDYTGVCERLIYF